jgi:hypothetical protein
VPRTATIALAVLFSAASALAQAPAIFGAIEGTVVDASGAAVPGVRVAARHSDRGILRTAVSGGQGGFYLGALPAGEWTLHMERDGFTALEVAAFPISIGQTVSGRWTLSVSGVASSIDVQERPDVLEAAATTASVALGGERIEESPSRGRSYLGFVSLAPGLAQSATGAQQRSMTGIRAPLADSGFSFAGIRARNNGISIDGVDNRDETTGGNRVAVGLEMVQEFRVAGISTGAEFGGAAGGLINVVTRTGVNDWHGDFTWFIQTGAVNARKTEVDTPRRPEYNRRQPGASVMGPLRRNRTFFAIAAELEQEVSEEWSETPAEAVRRINIVLGRSAVSRGLYPTSQRGADVTFKFNHQLGAKDALAVRYAWSRGRVLGDVQGPENFLDRSAAGNSDTADHSLAGSWIRVASPAVVNEVRGQYGRREQRLWPNGAGPLVEIPGVVSFGESARLRSERTEQHAEFVEQLNVTAGRHRLSAGASLHGVRFEGRLANRFAGVYLYPSLEAFERAAPAMYWQVRGRADTSMATTPAGLWFQERWQAGEGLLLEAGLRLDKQSMPEGAAESPANWSPRFGLAWRPGAKTPWIFRAGFGIFADRYPLAYLNDAVQKGRGAATEYVRAGAGPEMAARWASSPNFRAASGRKLSFGWERGFGSAATLHIEANFVRGFHLPRVRNAALTLPPLYLLEQTGRSDYRGLSIAYNRRAVKGVAVLVSDNLGRAWDDGSDFDEHPSQPDRIRADWSRSRQYQAQRVAASSVFELPFGDAPLPRRLKEVLDDWTLAPAFIAGSGRPVNALLTHDPLLTGAYPVSARPAGMPRNPGIGPAVVSLDARLMKTIPFRENRARLQFGVESFNALNHVNPVRMSEAYASPSGRLAGWGSLVESGAPRQVQFFAQFEY